MIERRSLLMALLSGVPDLRLKRSGFFRLEKADRWWLVTPEGKVFLSFGLNHVSLGLLLRPECVGHWAERFNVKDRGDPGQFVSGYRAKVRSDLEKLGMNTLGVHSSMRDIAPETVPYIHTVRFVNICHYMTPDERDFPDVFSGEFEKRCDRVARVEVLPRREERFLIGYFMTDCPIFTDLDAAPRGNNIYGAVRKGLPTWPRVLRNLGETAPGKRAYTALMREHYGEIGSFNRAYGTAFGSFENLLQARDWRAATDPANAAEARDNLAFLQRVVDRYYGTAGQAIRRYDPNHMIFGDKLNGNTDTPDSVVALAAKHFDLIFYQMYGYWEDQKPLIERWSAVARKPLFNGDSSYAVPYPEMPDPYGPHCATQEDRARAFSEFAHNAFARPDFVGWTWCGWMDGLKTQQKDKQHSGLQDPWGRFYTPLTAAMAGFSAGMYDVARNGAGA